MEGSTPQDLKDQINEQMVFISGNRLTKKLLISLFVSVIAVISIYFLSISTSPVVNTTATNGQKFYHIKNNSVYYQNIEIANADINTFKELGFGWAKDDNAVYLEGQRQAYLDPKTVKMLPNVYIQDKTAVWVSDTGYYMEVDKTDADPATFSVVSYGYGKDKKNIYYFAQKIVSADVNSFEVLNGWYAKDKNNVYYRSAIIPDAELKSFTFLGNEYAKDIHKVYYRGIVVDNADAGTFVLAGSYAKDINHVFYNGKMVNIDIDPKSFIVVSRNSVKDNKRVYFHDSYENTYDLQSGIDAPSFQHIGTCMSVERSNSSYYKDRNHIYINNYPDLTIDVQTFQYLGIYYGIGEDILPYSISYAKDKYSVYYTCGKILAEADPQTFEVFTDGYARDKNKVWFLGTLINRADLLTFQSLGDGYAKDKDYVYFAGIAIDNADIKTFTIVIMTDESGMNVRMYGKDKNNVYLGTKIIKGVNPANCTVESIENCNSK